MAAPPVRDTDTAAVPAVRILPMNQIEFPNHTAEEVQSQFFLQQLPSPARRGKYNYRTSGLNAEPGTVVLFQFDKRIIASGVLIRRERFARPAGDYRGALFFDPDTIRVFDSVSADVVREVWPEEFGGFSQVKWSLNVAAYPTFERRLTGVEMPHSESGS